MKTNRNTAIAVLCALIASLGLLLSATDATGADSKSKSKATSLSSKTKNHKTKLTADEKAQLKRVNEILKVLSTQKKSALTRLLNSGKQVELEALPGVGEATAEAIMKARPLESSAHLVLIKGIGEKTFKEIVDSRK